MLTEMLKPSEAAFVSGVTMRDMNRVFEEEILPEPLYDRDTEGSRRVSLPACPLVAFYFDAARQLTKFERFRVIVWTYESVGMSTITNILRSKDAFTNLDLVFWDDGVGVDLKRYLSKVKARLDTLAEASSVVEENPDIMGGVPVIRGSRIPVHDLAASVAAGVSRERILAAYPGLDEGTLDLAVAWAEANPAKGRPRRITDLLPSGTRLVASGSAPRRRA